MPKRRVFIRLGVLLLLGAVINVAVAWGLCLMSTHSRNGYFLPQVDDWLARNGIDPAALSANGVLAELRHPSLGKDHYAYVEPSANDVTIGHIRASHSRIGWPLRALDGGWVQHSGVGDRVIGAMDITWSPWIRRQDNDPTLPVTPLWAGMIVNTLFYAALLGLLIHSPIGMRQRLRRRRGQCVACGYPIGVSPVCTECGMPVTVPATNSAPRH